jgi:D-inositol-3-phosphate glycosyltransferase
MSQTVLNDLKGFRDDIPVTLSPHPLFDSYGTPVTRKEALEKLNLDADDSFLLFFGFIRAYKGLDLLIEAFSDKRLRNRRLKLIVAGEFYEDETPYKELIRKHKLDSEVIFYNHFIKDNEVSLFFSLQILWFSHIKLPHRAELLRLHFILKNQCWLQMLAD